MSTVVEGTLPVRHVSVSSEQQQRTSSAPAYAQHQGGQQPHSSAMTPRTSFAAGQSGSSGTVGAHSSTAASYMPTNNMASGASSHASSAVSSLPLTTKPAVIEYGNYRFCIHDAPTDSNLGSYIDFLLRKKTVALVRACEPTYDKTPLQHAGIKVVELPFQDGSPPPDSMIGNWLALVNEVFGPPAGTPKDKKEQKKADKEAGDKAEKAPKSNAIAVHCVAGLGRAPVLVCIALIECGMPWTAAVELVRKKRRGALNVTQLTYLETYKPRGKKDSCTIM